jgi:hypothetical protein
MSIDDDLIDDDLIDDDLIDDSLSGFQLFQLYKGFNYIRILEINIRKRGV